VRFSAQRTTVARSIRSTGLARTAATLAAVALLAAAYLAGA
jgi:hypothetical protein